MLLSGKDSSFSSFWGDQLPSVGFPLFLFSLSLSLSLHLHLFLSHPLPLTLPPPPPPMSPFFIPPFTQDYYKRSSEYVPTLHRERVGCFKMPVVHSTELIDLKWENTNNLLYWPQPDGFTGPVDDVVQFAFSAKKEG